MSAEYPRKSITSGPDDGQRIVVDVSCTDWGPIPDTPVHVWFRENADGSVNLMGAEPVDSEDWMSPHIHQPKDAPTMTVDIPAGDPDDPTWTDLDVR